MVAPVQVPVSPELNCGVFTASLLDPLLQVAAVGELIMVLACIGIGGTNMLMVLQIQRSSILQLLFLLFWGHVPLNPHARPRHRKINSFFLTSLFLFFLI